MEKQRDFAELRSTGLLWLINSTVFHPRGFALALHFDDDGNCTGWSMMGDGSEPWRFSADPVTETMVDDCFRNVNEFLAGIARRYQTEETK